MSFLKYFCYVSYKKSHIWDIKIGFGKLYTAISIGKVDK